MKGRVDVLGMSPPPCAWNVFNFACNRVEVPREIVDLGDVGVALVAIGHQANLQVRRRLAGSDLVGDGPDFLLGAFDESAMLPVVSRQKTTSTFGFFTSGFLSSADREAVSQKPPGQPVSSAMSCESWLFVPRVDAPQAAK